MIPLLTAADLTSPTLSTPITTDGQNHRSHAQRKKRRWLADTNVPGAAARRVMEPPTVQGIETREDCTIPEQDHLPPVDSLRIQIEERTDTERSLKCDWLERMDRKSNLNTQESPDMTLKVKPAHHHHHSSLPPSPPLSTHHPIVGQLRRLQDLPWSSRGTTGSCASTDATGPGCEKEVWNDLIVIPTRDISGKLWEHHHRRNLKPLIVGEE